MRTYTPKPKETRPARPKEPGNRNPEVLGLSPDANRMLQLQRTIGNQAVQRIRQAQKAGRVSPNPEINPVEDAHEREADRVAEQVVRMPEPYARQAPLPSATARDHASASGQPLDADTRAFMELRFGHDFRSVRVHADAEAREAARSVNARAFAKGSDLFFDAGQYRPRTHSGRKLLAHELSHVVQQKAAREPAGHSSKGNSPALQLTSAPGPRIQMRRWGIGEMPPMSQEQFREATVVLAMDLVDDNAPTLGPALRRVLEGDTAVQSLVDILDEAERRSVGMTFILQSAFAMQTAARLVRTFVLDPNTSSLDLLTENQRDRFRDFDWEQHDYPGGTEGDNEHRARQMANRLSEIRPQRRANTGDVAVVTETEHTAEVEQHIRDNLVDIPPFPAPQGGGAAPNQPGNHRLYRDAQQAFVRMRDAALADGVPLIVVSSYRDPEVARQRALAAGNPAAVASFSSHSLGLAVDLRMSLRYEDAAGQEQNLRYTETTTTPMQNVVDMRQSPVHKWMFLHGAAYGWYPYQNEPWHWEYNPEGYRDQFREAMNPPEPEAEPDPEEASPSGG